jgi:hypothetical protein
MFVKGFFYWIKQNHPQKENGFNLFIYTIQLDKVNFAFPPKQT